MSKKIRLSQMDSVHESLRQKRGHRSDRRAVWDEITKCQLMLAHLRNECYDIHESKASDLTEYQKRTRVSA